MTEEREEAINQWVAKLQGVAAKARNAGWSQTEILTALHSVLINEYVVTCRTHLGKPGITRDEAVRLACEEMNTANREAYRMFTGEELSGDKLDHSANNVIDMAPRKYAATDEIADAYDQSYEGALANYRQAYYLGCEEVPNRYRLDEKRYPQAYHRGYEGAPQIAARYGLDEKRYRQALRDQKFYDPRLAGHAHGARWDAPIGSSMHDAMIEAAERLAR